MRLNETYFNNDITEACDGRNGVGGGGQTGEGKERRMTGR